MITTIKWARCLVLAGFCAWFGTFVAANENPKAVDSLLQQELKLQEALYEYEVQGNSEGALKILGGLEGQLADENRFCFSFWLLKMRLYLEVGSVEEARTCYLKLKEVATSDAGKRDWLEMVQRWVPDTFIEREVPWKDGQQFGFRVGQKVGDSSVAAGLHFISISSVTVGGNEEAWRIAGICVCAEIWRYEVLLDKRSLQIRATQLNNEPLTTSMRQQLELAEAFTSESTEIVPVGIRADRSLSLSWLLDGILLQQCALELGYEQKFELYDIESGVSETGAVSVLSMELLELADGKRVPCWVADLKWEDEREAFTFSFENTDQRRLVRFQAGNVTATLLPESEAGRLRSILESTAPFEVP